jgi:hypothetical protein
MSRDRRQVIATTLFALFTLSAAIAAAQPGPPAAEAPPSASGAPTAEDCDPGVAAWTQAASKHTGLAITPIACPAGVVRLEIAGAGCDFEVARGHGFQPTADGKLFVSPIANLDWNVAPEPMKKALAGVLAALAHDPSLPIREGEPMLHPGSGATPPGSRRNQIIAGGAGGALVVAGGIAFWLKRRRGKAAAPAKVAPTEPAAAEPPAE